MGAYSNLDMELNYANDPFEEDESFVDESFEDEAQEELIPAPQEQPTPVPAENNPAPAAKPTASTADEDAKRKAHEEAEAKRKAEWEARQAEKKAAEQAQLDKLAAMSDDEVMMSSTQRVGADTERLTRRNMKECVAEHIQTMCLGDPAFARKVMHPRKSMIHCIWYINRKAREFVEQEMKDNGIKPENGIYGSDVPDDLCYQWAVDYFNDPDAQEDHRDDEKFVPKPYYGTAASSKKSAAKGKSTKKSTEKKADPKPKAQGDSNEQMSLLGVA